MTAPVDEKVLTDDEWFAAEDPPDAPGQDVSPGEDFTDEAPYGWMTDPKSGERRPKKRPGRPKVQATAEELAAAPPIERTPDRAPTDRPRGKSGPATSPAEVPMPRGGVIAKGVNRLYRRAGRIVRMMDHDIGSAIIACTLVEQVGPDEEPDLTVGEAWENLCKTNPRIRAWVLRVISGGTWGDLIMAHAPIALALLMKPMVMRLVPFSGLIGAWLEPDEDSAPSDLQPADAADMWKMAEDQAAKMAAKMGMGPVDPAVVAAARAQAEQMAARARGGPREGELEHGVGVEGMATVPPGFRRQQPQRGSRASRKGKR